MASSAWPVWLSAFWCIVLVQGYTGAKMGVESQTCDDGKTNLTLDWDMQFEAYTCMELQKYSVDENVKPSRYVMPDLNPKTDQVHHFCMNTPIKYKDSPPLRGHHRPLWAKFGEYLFVPPQRWLHNLEHGSVVMLYHPCADSLEVNSLRSLVTSCLYRHIITPYSGLSAQRPLALLTWGAKLEMNKVDFQAAIDFMQKHAHLSPEDLSKDGQYDLHLLKHAEEVSDKEDTVICPWTRPGKKLTSN